MSDLALPSALGTTTRFGSQWLPLDRSVAVLRARALRHLDQALEVTTIDAAAAVVGVDAWMLALGATNLDLPARFGTDAVGALAACLGRSIGLGGPCVGGILSPPAPEAWLPIVEGYITWVNALGEDPTEVLGRAAADLGIARGNTRLVSAAGLLEQASSAA